MEITIDQETVQAAVNKQLSTVVERAVGEYAVTDAIRKSIADAIGTDLIRVATEEAIGQIDKDAIRAAISDQMSRTMIKGVSMIVESAIVDMLVRLENPGYMTDGQREKVAMSVRARMADARK